MNNVSIGSPTRFHFSPGSRAATPTGVPGISRGLSEAIPPKLARRCRSTLEGSQFRRRNTAESEVAKYDLGCWHPSGVQCRIRILTGGIASLNPRLMAATPHGVKARDGGGGVSAARAVRDVAGRQNLHIAMPANSHDSRVPVRRDHSRRHPVSGRRSILGSGYAPG